MHLDALEAAGQGSEWKRNVGECAALSSVTSNMDSMRGMMGVQYDLDRSNNVSRTVQIGNPRCWVTLGEFG